MGNSKRNRSNMEDENNMYRESHLISNEFNKITTLDTDTMTKWCVSHLVVHDPNDKFVLQYRSVYAWMMDPDGPAPFHKPQEDIWFDIMKHWWEWKFVLFVLQKRFELKAKMGDLIELMVNTSSNGLLTGPASTEDQHMIFFQRICTGILWGDVIYQCHYDLTLHVFPEGYQETKDERRKRFKTYNEKYVNTGATNEIRQMLISTIRERHEMHIHYLAKLLEIMGYPKRGGVMIKCFMDAAERRLSKLWPVESMDLSIKHWKLLLNQQNTPLGGPWAYCFQEVPSFQEMIQDRQDWHVRNSPLFQGDKLVNFATDVQQRIWRKLVCDELFELWESILAVASQSIFKGNSYYNFYLYLIHQYN